MEPEEKGADTNILDVDKLIEERERLESLFQEKFTKLMTVMFTDLKGSTSIAESSGDLASHTLIKQHNEILFPLIKKNNGVLVKTMGDGTLSYFENPQDAVRSAIQIQRDIDKYNTEKRPKTLILVRIGLHTGKGVVEKNDIFGDVVNTASRFKSSANPGEIYLSEETYDSLTDKSEFYCRFIKTTTLKGKKEAVKVYKAFWNPKEIEADKYEPKREKVVIKKGLPLFAKVIIGVIVPLIIAFGLMFGVFPNPFRSSQAVKEERRSLEHTVTIPMPEEEE